LPAGFANRRDASIIAVSAIGFEMPSLSGSFVGIAVVAVAIVLVSGLVNMLRGGSGNRSQLLMRWRVGLQFVAILVIVAVLYFRGH
jgi:hypothetical protein